MPVYAEKLAGLGILCSVVRTMKSLAIATIGQYEQSLLALADYYRTIELGLSVCFRKTESTVLTATRKDQADGGVIGAVVFGSDQGLVGQFNDVVADYAIKSLPVHWDKVKVFAVGERVHARLADAGLPGLELFTAPNSIKTITPLIGQILVESETPNSGVEVTELHLFHNRPKPGEAYEPVHQKLLPLDENWRRNLVELSWPTGNLPEILGNVSETLRVFIRSYLFVSLFRACAESLASENASRLAAMQRADKNIAEMLDDSREHIIVCAKAPSMRNYSTSSPASKRWSDKRKSKKMKII